MAVLDLSELLDVVCEEFDVYTLEEHAEITYRTLVLQGVLFTQSLDHDKIAQWMFEDQGEYVPVEVMRDISQMYVPILQAEDQINGKGQLSAEAALSIHDHLTQRYGGGIA